jgi:two-component system nitrate/nitrite response regulator NarL
VVIVDDSAAHRILVGLAVERDVGGVVVGEARDGLEGLRVITKCRPDVAIIDVHMPGLGGIELIQQLRVRSNLPTRLVAYSDDSAGLAEALRVGADASVAKSPSVDELVQAIAGGTAMMPAQRAAPEQSTPPSKAPEVDLPTA